MLAIVIDPYRFQPRDVFASDIARFLEWVKSSRTVTPAGEILVPGEPEQRTRAARLKNGIELDDITWRELRETGAALGVECPP